MAVKRLVVIAAALFSSWIAITSPVTAAALVLLLASTFLCIKIKAEHFLAIFILLYPVLPFQAGFDLGPNVPVVRVHRLALLALMLCWISKKPISESIRSFFKFPLTHLLWIALPVYIFSYLSKGNFKGWVFFIGNFFLENFMIAFIFYDVLKEKTPKEVKRIFFFIGASVIVPCVLGIAEHISGTNIFSKIEPYRELLKEAFPMQMRLGLIRVRGAFIHSISYGLFFAMALPAGLLVLTLRDSNIRRRSLLLAVFLALCFTGSYISLSRVAFLAFFLNAALLLFFSNVFAAIACSALVFFIFTQPFFMYGLREKIALLTGGIFGRGYQTSEMASSAYGRIEQLALHWRSITGAPFLGTGGLGSTDVIDNNYLTLMLNSGLFGLAIYLAFFILPLALSLKMLMRSRDVFYRNLSFYTIVVLVNTFLIFTVLSLTDYLYIVWIYIGIFMASRVIYERQAA